MRLSDWVDMKILMVPLGMPLDHIVGATVKYLRMSGSTKAEPICRPLRNTPRGDRPVEDLCEHSARMRPRARSLLSVPSAAVREEPVPGYVEGAV